MLVRDSDPPGYLIRMDFVLDPPLALPHPGLYAFFLQLEACDAGEISFIASDHNPYPDGIFWLSGRVTTLPCFLRQVDGGEDSTDVIFEMGFCRAASTPVRRHTWGKLKVIYR